MYGNAPMTAPAPKASDPGMGQKVCATLKSLATSPLLIIAAACYTLILVLNVFLSGSAMDANSLYPLLREMGMSYRDINAMMSGTQSYYIIGLIIGMIPSILVAIGMWVTIASGTNHRSRNMTTSGLTIIQVIQIIMTVLSGLAILLLLLMVIILSGTVTRYAEEATVILAICGFVVIAAGAFVIFYNVMIISTISKIKESIRTNTPNSRVSMFVAVMCIISGSFSALSVLSSLITPSFGGTYFVISLLSSILNALCPILLGALLIVYRGRMRQLEDEVDGRFAPVYVPAPVVPVAPVYSGYAAGQSYAPIPAPQYIQPQPVMPNAPVQPVVQEAPVQPVVQEAPVQPVVQEAPVQPVVQEVPAEPTEPVSDPED